MKIYSQDRDSIHPRILKVCDDKFKDCGDYHGSMNTLNWISWFINIPEANLINEATNDFHNQLLDEFGEFNDFLLDAHGNIDERLETIPSEFWGLDNYGRAFITEVGEANYNAWLDAENGYDVDDADVDDDDNDETPYCPVTSYNRMVHNAESRAKDPNTRARYAMIEKTYLGTSGKIVIFNSKTWLDSDHESAMKTAIKLAKVVYEESEWHQESNTKWVIFNPYTSCTMILELATM